MPGGPRVSRHERVAVVPHKRELNQSVKRDERLGLWAVIIGAIAFGSLGLFGQAAFARGIAIPTLLLWRFAGGALIVYVAALALREAPIPRGRLPAVCGLGVLYTLQAGLFLGSVADAGPPIAIMLLFTFPVIIEIAERLAGRGGGKRSIISVALACGGVWLMVAAPGSGLHASGLVFGLSAAVVYASYILLAVRLLAGLPPLRSTATLLATAAVVYFVIVLVRGLPVVPFDRAQFVLGGSMAFVATAIPILGLSIGLPRIGAQRSSILGTLEPLTTVVLSVVLLHATLTPRSIAGMACVLAAGVLRVLL